MLFKCQEMFLLGQNICAANQGDMIISALFTLSFSINVVMSLAISITRIKLLRFLKLINQTSHSENGLEPQLIRYDTGIDNGAPNQSLTLSVNGP